MIPHPHLINPIDDSFPIWEQKSATTSAGPWRWSFVSIFRSIQPAMSADVVAVVAVVAVVVVESAMWEFDWCQRQFAMATGDGRHIGKQMTVCHKWRNKRNKRRKQTGRFGSIGLRLSPDRGTHSINSAPVHQSAPRIADPFTHQRPKINPFLHHRKNQQPNSIHSIPK